MIPVLRKSNNANAKWSIKIVLSVQCSYSKDDTNKCFTWKLGYSTQQKLTSREEVGFPWWRSGWESACQCRGHGFEPWSGKIPHATGQLGPWATVTEPARLEPVLRNKRGRDSERPAHRDEEWPPLTAIRESPLTETKTQHSKNK